MDTIKLTPRLQCVADCIQKCQLLADIGTDHAYIPIYAIKNGIATNAIASDVVKGPLKIATDNIKSHGLENKISPRLANGLESADGADVIVIAGMGGKLICTILENSIEIAKKADYMVIQPMTCCYELRRFLHENGFSIREERLAREEDKIYNIMVVEKGTEQFDDDFYYHIGKKLFEANDPLLFEHIKMRAEVIHKQIEGLKKASDPQLHLKAAELEATLRRFIQEADKNGKSC